MADDEEMEELAIHSKIKVAMKQFREARGWTQQRMARNLRISTENYKKYEQPSTLCQPRKVPLVVVWRFADLFGFNLKELLEPHSRKANG